LRRSELIGLMWSEVDLAQRRIYVRQAQVDDVLDSTKSEDSVRILVIDQFTADVPREWRKAQLAERLAWGSAWTDSGRVFTREDGTPPRPGWLSERFGTLSARADLPPVTFHGLRHGAATMLFAAGQPIKVISEILGHTTSAFTADVYTEVAEKLAEQAASAITAYVPRQSRMSQQRVTERANGRRTRPGNPCGTAGIPRPRAEARGFEPRKGANPNRISSAAP